MRLLNQTYPVTVLKRMQPSHQRDRRPQDLYPVENVGHLIVVVTKDQVTVDDSPAPVATHLIPQQPAFGGER